jgi:hypothetical protein
VQPPRGAVAAREQQAPADIPGKQLLPHVAPHGLEHVDCAGMEAPDFLASDDLALDVALLDQEGVLANVPHLQPE